MKHNKTSEVKVFFLKVIAASLIISFVSWLSGKKPGLAGFLTALPLSTILALAFSQLEWQNPEQSTQYAKSILTALPISLLFFMPFLIAEKTQWPFWTNYSLGIFLLIVGYFIHKLIFNH